MHNIAQKIEQAKAYIQHKAGALKRSDGKFLRMQEVRLENKVARQFKKQMEWVISGMEKLPFFQNNKGVKTVERKTAQDEINQFLDDLPVEDLADDIATNASATYAKGAKRAAQDLAMSDVGVSFSLINHEAVAYINKLKTLHISNFKGSISRETKKKIRNILLDMAETGTSYSEASRQITKQAEAGVFSRARAEMIAVNQIGNAYGSGNETMVERYIQETKATVEKQWVTVGDDRVTPECNANQAEGWIPFNSYFLSGDSHAPRATNPRCRCVVAYRRLDLQGQEI